MIDLSFLTDEEKETIRAVLKRDNELKQAEEKRVKSVQLFPFINHFCHVLLVDQSPCMVYILGHLLYSTDTKSQTAKCCEFRIPCS